MSKCVSSCFLARGHDLLMLAFSCHCFYFTGEKKDGMLRIGSTTVPTTTHSSEAKVPDVLFYDNPQVRPEDHYLEGHSRAPRNIGEVFELGLAKIKALESFLA